MAHKIYHTNFFLIGKYNIGESDSIAVLFTKDFGRIHALVKGYRKDISKLRPHLSLFSFGKVSLVRGKLGFRVVAVEDTGLTTEILKSSKSRVAIAQIMNIIKRLVRGEDPQPELFDDLVCACQEIRKNISVEKDKLEQLELIAVFRLLYFLGYIPDIPELRRFTNDLSWEEISYEENLKSWRKTMIETINDSLQATQL